MTRILLVVVCIASGVAPAKAQEREAIVRKDAVSVHTVERGAMPIVSSAAGSLISLQPARAVLRFDDAEARCEAGRTGRFLFTATQRPLGGKVVGRAEAGGCEIEFTDALPAGAAPGSPVQGLLVTGEMKDVIFFGRPATSRANSTDTIFVLEGDSAARRVVVRYGVMSGPSIQVRDGLSPGHRVIVTDLSKWADRERIRLE